MADYQPIDYRLRCHTKRTDLPVDVLRDIGEAYAEIQRLQRERDEARKDRAAYRIEIDRLIGQRDEARREIMNGVIDQACSNEEIEEEYRKRVWSYLKKENTNG
jgi:seryl-tRNA synthetase